MGLKAWVNFRPTTARREILAMSKGGGTPEEIGVINSQQSVITFAGAPAAVSLMWKVLCKVWPSLAGQDWIVLVLSLSVGALIYLASAPGSGTRGEFIRGFMFTLINSFAIASAALGITTVTS